MGHKGPSKVPACRDGMVGVAIALGEPLSEFNRRAGLGAAES